jgi:hypothetical protein
MRDDAEGHRQKLVGVAQVESNPDGQSVDQVVQQRTDEVQVPRRLLRNCMLLELFALGPLQLAFFGDVVVIIVAVPVVV